MNKLFQTIFLFFLLVSPVIPGVKNANGKPFDDFSQKEFQISSGKVGSFAIGKAVGNVEILQGSLSKGKESVWQEGVQYQYDNYILSKNGKLLLKIYCENSSGTEIINEIFVFSELFRTDKNIRVGSKIRDFTREYSNFKIWFTYVSNRYVIESPDLKGIQFEIKKEDYMGSPKGLFKKSTVDLKINEFEVNARIKSIRVY